MCSVEEFSLGRDGWRLGEAGLGAEMLQDDILSVRELEEEAINALVHKGLGLIVDIVTVSQIIILVSVWVNGQIQLMHLLDVRTVVAVSIADVFFRLHDPG